MLKFHKIEKGIALVAAVVVTLIVSLVALAIADTAIANRHLSSATYDQSSSLVNAQAGLNLAEHILLEIQKTDSDKFNTKVTDFDDKGSDSSIAQLVSSSCSDDVADLDSPNDCFWWLGNVLASDGAYNKENFLTHIGEGFYDFEHAGTYFRLEKRREHPPYKGTDMEKQFFRATAIGTGNGAGLVKLQGQVAVLLPKDVDTSYDGGDNGDGGGNGPDEKMDNELDVLGAPPSGE